MTRITFKEKRKRKKIADGIACGKVLRGRTSVKRKLKKEKKMFRLKNLFEKHPGVLSFSASLSAKKIHRNGLVENYGVISTKKVTDAFVAYLVDSLQDSGTYPMSDFKYHDSGTGIVGENKTDTALGTPCGESRDVGTQIEGATANIYKTVATHTYAGTFAITEHGVFSAAASGTLMDRSVFSAINVGSGDKIEFTYELTANSET